MGLPTDAAARKELPIWTGVIMYFPDVLAAIAEVSKKGNDQHNPDEPLHWAREKSTDQMNTAIRHMLDHARGTRFDTDGSRHLAKAIWRLCAELQLDIEKDEPKLTHAGDAEEGCPATSPTGRWCCERGLGHTGDHAAWEDYETNTYYKPDGRWS